MEDVITLSTMPNTTCRRPVGGYQNQSLRGEAQKLIDGMTSQPAQIPARRSQQTTGPRRGNAYQQRRGTPVDTDQDTQIAPGARTGTRAQPAQYNQRPSRRQLHPLVWIGLTLLILWFVWIIGTTGAGWWTAHISDPPQFGPLHGTSVTGVFGGGDSQAQPSRLFGWNDNGHVRIIFFHADDPSKAQILTGPNLTLQGFPDPTGAQIQLQTGDFPDATGSRDGNLDLRVTILSTVFDFPFHRYQQYYIMYGDGQGNLKTPQGGG